MTTLTDELVDKALREGLRVFRAEHGKGSFGIISTQDGSKIMAFGRDIHNIGLYLCTCYKPSAKYGDGVIIKKDITMPSTLDLRSILGNITKSETLQEHLDRFEMCNYVEQ